MTNWGEGPPICVVGYYHNMFEVNVKLIWFPYYCGGMENLTTPIAACASVVAAGVSVTDVRVADACRRQSFVMEKCLLSILRAPRQTSETRSETGIKYRLQTGSDAILWRHWVPKTAILWRWLLTWNQQEFQNNMNEIHVTMNMTFMCDLVPGLGSWAPR